MAWKKCEPSFCLFHSPLPFHSKRAHEKTQWHFSLSFYRYINTMLSKLLPPDSTLVFKSNSLTPSSLTKNKRFKVRLMWDRIPCDRYLGEYNSEMSKPLQTPSTSMSYLKGAFAYLPLSSSFLPPFVSFLLWSEPSAAFCAQVLLLNRFCLTFWLFWKQNYGNQN